MTRYLIPLLGLFLSVSAQAESIVVSSKIDTEGSLLGNLIYQRLDNAGLDVENRVQLGGTPIVRKAITSGEIDIYPEYTGNAAFFFNQAEDPAWKSFEEGYEKAKQLDYEANKIVWLTPANANNTWAIAVRQEIADQGELSSMSDFGRYVSEGGEIKLAASSEFVSSPAVLPAFQETYGFTLNDSQLLVLSGGNTAATIKAAALQTDGTNAAMVYGTDGAISAVGLVVMSDDKGVQPVYAPAPIIREEVLNAHPEIAELLAPVFESFDLETLQSLNARIAIGGENASDVAASYLEELGLSN
ncbi:glycine betaine ABC transporter substrate-binding protein OsmF [Marinobacterium mangrovicola]|uniref:Osmoprotectant transport system substrate-binding protein n=1 Tax=Marinobacterium mangrovicola TaxID=1476959 RepID=A0A4R1GPP2_9GAMM|nr:ABC transporter substrate-binding protein [Marinobacterium mangrovicola]TCK09300.1 osmoprotectant transport system substrate-binding protein [Marinobacterium mangrovicola]